MNRNSVCKFHISEIVICQADFTTIEINQGVARSFFISFRRRAASKYFFNKAKGAIE
jgi:hypothetical protein